jgi:5-methylcytosine-specific restriction endonuclease McrA
MKKCQTESCTRLVKNSYNHCYECNSKAVKEEGESGSEPEVIESTAPYKKETIPKCVRNALWINFFKDKRNGICQCCMREPITIGNFHAGHITAEVNGGRTALDNLVPLCMLCNTSMQRRNLNDFIVKYNLHHGLD